MKNKLYSFILVYKLSTESTGTLDIISVWVAFYGIFIAVATVEYAPHCTAVHSGHLFFLWITHRRPIKACMSELNMWKFVSFVQFITFCIFQDKFLVI